MTGNRWTISRLWRRSFGPDDIRYTTRDGILLGWPPDGKVCLRSLGTRLTLHERPVATVRLLGQGPVPWRRDVDGLHATLPSERPGHHAWVLAIT